jgi:hypothetical protein
VNAENAGNKALADRIRNTDKQPTGRSNNWGASAGGPVYIPRIYNGKNKLFWFFTYNAFKDIKTEDPSTFNRTVPTANGAQWRFRRDVIASELVELHCVRSGDRPRGTRRVPRTSSAIRYPPT